MTNKLSFLLSLLLLPLFINPASGQDTAYFCPPCNSACDVLAYKEAGDCPHCGMTLLERPKKEQMEEIQQQKLRIAALIHDGMEILDFAGPVEVFTSAGFEVYTVGPSEAPIISQGVVKISPQYSVVNAPPPDIIAVFGGNSGQAVQNQAVIGWIKANAPKTELLFSVCTGAFYYAKAGLLDGKQVTTFHESLDGLRAAAPKAEVISGVKYVDASDIISAAGVSSGIDGALYLVSRLRGQELANAVAAYMEYDAWFGRK